MGLLICCLLLFVGFSICGLSVMLLLWVLVWGLMGGWQTVVYLVCLGGLVFAGFVFVFVIWRKLFAGLLLGWFVFSCFSLWLV